MKDLEYWLLYIIYKFFKKILFRFTESAQASATICVSRDKLTGAASDKGRAN